MTPEQIVAIDQLEFSALCSAARTVLAELAERPRNRRLRHDALTAVALVGWLVDRPMNEPEDTATENVAEINNLLFKYNHVGWLALENAEVVAVVEAEQERALSIT